MSFGRGLREKAGVVLGMVLMRGRMEEENEEEGVHGLPFRPHMWVLAGRGPSKRASEGGRPCLGTGLCWLWREGVLSTSHNRGALRAVHGGHVSGGPMPISLRSSRKTPNSHLTCVFERLQLSAKEGLLGQGDTPNPPHRPRKHSALDHGGMGCSREEGCAWQISVLRKC